MQDLRLTPSFDDSFLQTHFFHSPTKSEVGLHPLMSTQRVRSRKHETAASNKTPRQINRNLIFNLVRTKQPVSRADLSRLTGLQRSTISLIVEELIKDGWLVEGSIGKLPRGRNPTFLGLNRSRAILAVDIHPTQTTIAVTDIEGTIISQQVLMLPQDANKALHAIVGAIRKIQLLHEDLSLYGICLPGRTDLTSNNLIFAPNLQWPVLALKQKMERATGLRVKMDNVANACALSEVWFQSSDGQHDLVVVNVSEGIGTGIFVNGTLLRGERGDQPATQASTQMAEYLGWGIRIISVALAPKEIVVVGEITTAWHSFGSIIENQLKKNAFTKVPILRPAYDGNTARLRSAVLPY
jgi:predicted NBD/HSP70 family sugar kinase